MAAVENVVRPRVMPFSRPDSGAPRPKAGGRPRLSLPNELHLMQREDGRRRSPNVATQTQNSATNRRGSKRRVSDSTPGWHPRNKKRPRSDGDVNAVKTMHVKASPFQPVQKSGERSVERLSQQIWNDYCHTRQTAERYEQKLHLRDYLLSIFRTAFPGCSLHICGSTCSGLGTNDSDVDLCLLLTETRQIDQRFEARRILHQLNTMLRKSAYLHRCHVIHAKVPILKFRDLKSGCECDVNVNNTVVEAPPDDSQVVETGCCGFLRESRTPTCYKDIRDFEITPHIQDVSFEDDWRVCPLIMIVKKWAKRHGINDASQGTLSSYSIVMMVLHYLQDPCKPPVIPALQLKYPEIFNGERNILELTVENPCIRIVPERLNNQESLGELLLGFFRYYAEEFRWDEDVICVRRGEKYPRGKSDVWLKKYICIEEPFDFSCVARAVHTQEKFDEIKQRIRIAYYTLTVSPFIESILSGS